MHYDVAIIGAGLSGLAAGIRAAYFDRRTCVLERHYAYGGLNSYYRLGGREFDVGLHALTNYVPPGRRHAPLNKIFRQLKLRRDELDLCEQRYSEIRFPGRSLRFSNDPALLESDIADAFPSQADGYRRLVADLDAYDDVRIDATWTSARDRLADYLTDPVLVDMLLCPVMFYGSPEPHDMDFTHFATIFKALYREGFARPRGGVRPMIRALVKAFRRNGGDLRMRCGVEALEVDGGRVKALHLEDGTTITADVVLSSAGYVETMAMVRGAAVPTDASDVGGLSFVESMAVTDCLPSALGHDATIVFYNDAERFTYACPEEDIDVRSGVVCCPSNFEGHDDMPEGLFRMTWLANPGRWAAKDPAAYAAAKAVSMERFLAAAERFVPGIRSRIVATDAFTPCTITRFTGHRAGAVYGSPRKRRDGRTPIENLLICGTDQGYLGIIGAMLSGITIANLHVLEGQL